MKKHGDEGSGWWRQSRRHRDAAFKGRRGKRPKHEAQQGTISAGKLEALRTEYLATHSPQSIKMDQRQEARTLYEPNDPEQVRKWKEHYNESDLDGVDTVGQALINIKVATLPKLQSKRDEADRIVRKAKKRAQELSRKKMSKEARAKGIKEALQQAKDALSKVSKEAKELVVGAREKQDKVISKHQGKWSAERHKRAEDVSKTVGCSVFEADALISRAKRAGVDYDLVRWDDLQGDDLEFTERVEKLNRSIHADTMSKAELDGMQDFQLYKAEHQFEDWMRESNRRLEEDFAGDAEAMTRHDLERDRREAERGDTHDPMTYA